jgi:hypothetical protein
MGEEHTRKTIIETDIDFYTNEVERCTWFLQHCHVSEEHYWQMRAEGAKVVLEALKKYEPLVKRKRS